MGEKENFSGPILNYDTQFPLKCNFNESRNNDNSLLFLFQYFQQLIFNILRDENDFERKMFFTFQKGPTP